jgi:hypothetical protein
VLYLRIRNCEFRLLVHNGTLARYVAPLCVNFYVTLRSTVLRRARFCALPTPTRRGTVSTAERGFVRMTV